MTKIIAPHADDEWKSNITMTLKATLGINGVAKLVRHNLGTFKKNRKSSDTSNAPDESSNDYEIG